MTRPRDSTGMPLYCDVTLAGQRTLQLYMGNAPTTPEGEWTIDRIRPWIADENHPHPNPAVEGEIRYFVPGREGIEHEVAGPERVKIDGQRNPTAVPEALMRAAEGWVKLTIIAKDVVPQIEAAIARLDA